MLFPQDLWELIAFRMPAKDWAKARGTCRAMHEAKHTLKMAPVSTHEMVWMVKAVPNAKKLWLDITELAFGVCSASSFRKAWGDHNAGLQHLQQLSLTILGSSSKKPNSERQEPFSTWLTAIADILDAAHNLVTPRLDLPSVPGLPPMTKLEHVNLLTCLSLTEQSCQWLHTACPACRLSALCRGQMPP